MSLDQYKVFASILDALRIERIKRVGRISDSVIRRPTEDKWRITPSANSPYSPDADRQQLVLFTHGSGNRPCAGMIKNSICKNCMSTE
jgi:hypothetical protein